MSSKFLLDSSAVLKLFIVEDHSRAMTVFAQSNLRYLFGSKLLIPEVLGNLAKLGQPTGQAADFLTSISLVEINARVLQRSIPIVGGGLRTLDAIHLATALELGDAVLVSYEEKLAERANLHGVQILRP